MAVKRLLIVCLCLTTLTCFRGCGFDTDWTFEIGAVAPIVQITFRNFAGLLPVFLMNFSFSGVSFINLWLNLAGAVFVTSLVIKLGRIDSFLHALLVVFGAYQAAIFFPIIQSLPFALLAGPGNGEPGYVNCLLPSRLTFWVLLLVFTELFWRGERKRKTSKN